VSDGSAGGNSFQLVSEIAAAFQPVQVSFLSISASSDPFLTIFRPIHAYFSQFLLISELSGLFCFGLGCFYYGLGCFL
jgi:hypothetical protein